MVLVFLFIFGIYINKITRTNYHKFQKMKMFTQYKICFYILLCNQNDYTKILTK